jgi:hypothetical protein
MHDKLNDLNHNKVFRLRNLLNEIVKDGFSIINKFNGTIKHITVITYSNYLLRFIYCFEAILTLLKDFENNKTYHEYSIALILRASLLDLLTIFYLKSYYLELQTELNLTEPNYNSEFGKLLSSQIRRSFNVKKNTKDFKPEVFKRFVDKVKSNYSYLFKNDKLTDYNSPTKSLIYNRHEDEISLKKIEKRLDFVSNQSNKDYINIFYLYDHYSKYDHFGLMGITLMKMDINEIFQNILKSLYYIVDGVSYCMEFMREEENIEIEYENIRRKCGELRGTVITEYLYLSDEYKNKN